MKRIGMALVAISLAACSSPHSGRLSTGINTPLHDFNLTSTEIPFLLLEARKHPYARSAELSCASIDNEIVQLDDLLGPDLDSVTNEEGGAEAAVSEAAGNALQSVINGVLPFRSWIRRLTGAERHTRDLAAAITAGAVRRGYLKGLRLHYDCAPAPMPAPAGPPATQTKP